MIGRGAVRNPWIFSQIRDHLAGREIRLPIGRDVLAFVEALYESACSPDVPERSQVQKMKKYMNFLGEGLTNSEPFLHDIRRANKRAEFFAICKASFDHERPMPLVPTRASLP